MATKTIAERGIDHASITFERRPGNPAIVTVRIPLDRGADEVVLGAAELAAALTPAERTGLLAVLGKIYQAGLAAGGFTG